MDIKSISSKPEKWIVDRFEGTVAVLMNASMKTKNIYKPLLPADVKPGQTVVYSHGKWSVDDADSTERSARINDKFAKLKARNNI